MPAHIYYRVGQYRRSLDTNKLAVKVDERYFERSPSDPMYRSAYYPHNIHFVMVSAQMGGDGATAIDAAKKLDAAVPAELAKQFQIMEPVKAAPFTTHLQFAEPDAVLALAKPDDALVLVRTMYHYARAVALARKRDAAAARAETDAIAALEAKADFKPYDAWGVPAKAIVQTARLVATGRIADAAGDLDGAAKAYEDAIAIEDSLSYTEPPYWYYPVRQSLGSVRLRQDRLDDAERASATRWPACATTAGRSPGLPRSTRRRATATARRRRSARMRGLGSGQRAGRNRRGFERAAVIDARPSGRYFSKGGSGFVTHSSPKISGSAYTSIRA
jgi:tetratricopeptide (TPR) repeat protein